MSCPSFDDDDNRPDAVATLSLFLDRIYDIREIGGAPVAAEATPAAE